MGGGKEAGGQLVDQRLLPRIVEGEVRMQMVKDTLFSIIHKKPTAGNMSAVGGIADYTFYTPDAPEFASLRAKFEADMPKIMSSMGLENVPVGKFVEGTTLVDLIGKKAVETLDERAAGSSGISMKALDAKLDLILSKLK